MPKNKKILISTLVLSGLILSAQIALAADDAPPSFSLKIDAEDSNTANTNNTNSVDKPPSFNLAVPDEDENTDKPPSFSLSVSEDDETKLTTTGSGIKLTSVSAAPKSFNALIDETKISYTLSSQAIVEMKIIDQNNETIVQLLDNQTINAGDYFIRWNGTKDNKSSGIAVSAGKYKYRIIAKNPTTTAVADTSEGDIDVFTITTASSSSSSLSNSAAVNSSGGTAYLPSLYNATGPTTTGSYYPSNVSAYNQPGATISLQNSSKGKTAGTGPGILIYSIFPLAGYFMSRKKTKKS